MTYKHLIRMTLAAAACLHLWGCADESPADESRLPELLREQGFLIDDGGAEIARICSIYVSGTRYDFYHYTHVDPSSERSSPQMVAALIEVRNGDVYVGSYTLTLTTPSCDQQANEVLFTSVDGRVDRVRIDASGLPPLAMIDGDPTRLVP